MEHNSEDVRNHRVKCDYGLNDYYKHFIKETGATHISGSQFSEILKEFNSHVRDRISKKGAEFIMPHRMGKIELRKFKPEVVVTDDGKIKNNLPPNWKETWELWKENPKAREQGVKIRYTNDHTGGYTFRVSYIRSKANYRHKSIFNCKFNRDLKRQLSKSIFEGRIDAFLK